MKINKKTYRTIWIEPENKKAVKIIDQRKLPNIFEVINLVKTEDFITAIKDMYVRGAGLIGATAGYAMYIAALEAPESDFDQYLMDIGKKLIMTRPTAKNLEWAVDKQIKNISKEKNIKDKIQAALNTAEEIADEDADSCRRIGEYGLEIISKISEQKNGETVNILTHCNAGWLAFVDYGSATSPIYLANKKGIDLHVWVDETRPRNQGANLTAWEFCNENIPHHLIADNTGGLLMQKGLVDLVIVGADRVSRTGDVANKIGTYLKALAAKDNNIPFYVAFPSSTFDWDIRNGINEIEIEERDQDEVRYVCSYNKDGLSRMRICPEETKAKNYGFDVTSSDLITGLITERGISEPNEASILNLYKEKDK